jgi:hypothetical protein
MIQKTKNSSKNGQTGLTSLAMPLNPGDAGYSATVPVSGQRFLLETKGYSLLTISLRTGSILLNLLDYFSVKQFHNEDEFNALNWTERFDESPIYYFHPFTKRFEMVNNDWKIGEIGRGAGGEYVQEFYVPVLAPYIALTCRSNGIGFPLQLRYHLNNTDIPIPIRAIQPQRSNVFNTFVAANGQLLTSVFNVMRPQGVSTDTSNSSLTATDAVYKTISGLCRSTVNNTAFSLEVSPNNISWYELQRLTLSPNVSVEIREQKLYGQYYRFRYTGTNATSFVTMLAMVE